MAALPDRPPRERYARIAPLLRRARDKSLVRNSIYIMATTVVTSLLGYVYWIVAARTYTAFDVGLASALVSTMTLASTLSNLGLGQTLTQILPRSTAGAAWSLAVNAAFGVALLTGLLAGGIVLIVLPHLGSPLDTLGNSVLFAAIFVAGVPLWTASTLLDATFVAERSAGKMLARNTAFALLKLALIVAPIVLLGHATALTLVSSWVIATALSCVGSGFLLLPRLHRGYSMVFRGAVAQVRSMVRSLAGNHSINLGGLAAAYLLPVLVSVRLSATDNAYFYTTWMLGGFLFMIETSVASSLFAEGEHAPEEIWRKVRTSSVLAAALLIPAMVVFLFLGRSIMEVFGPSYPQNGGPLLTVLIIAAVPDGITNVAVAVLRVRRRIRDAAILNLGMAVLTLVLAWQLAPVLGIVGVGWAWLIAQSIGSIAMVIYFFVGRGCTQRPLHPRNVGQSKPTPTKAMHVHR